MVYKSKIQKIKKFDIFRIRFYNLCRIIYKRVYIKNY